jgi:phenylacetate-coenzyme A ligase PaaK-like adenylate-forming protein
MSFSAKLIWRLMKPKIFQSYTQQQKIRKLPLEEIKKIQWDRLKNLITYVNKNSIFYHEEFKKINFDINNFKSYDDFRKIPIIDKNILKKNYDTIIPKGISKKDYVISYTSGSTGEPFSFLLDKKQEPPKTFAAFMLNKENVGINPFKKQNEIMIKAEPVNKIKKIENNKKNSIPNLIRSHFFSETFGIKSLDIKKENIDWIYTTIKKRNILGIYGYSSNVFNLAKLFNENNLKIKLNYVILIAEGILKQQKEFISNIFNCPVYSDYGASECMRMGFECKNQNYGYHMDIYNYYLEFLNDQGNPAKIGENADVVVTNLNNHIFPLIRYKIGDRCIISNKKCPCDINYPLISKIIGRKSEVIKTPENNEISLSNFAVLFEYLYEQIIQYQIIVDYKNNTIKIKLIPTKKFDITQKNHIKNQILDLLNHSMNVDIEIVTQIELDKTGKTKTIIIK